MAYVDIHWTCEACRHLNQSRYEPESAHYIETYCEDCDLYYFWSDILRDCHFYTLIEPAPNRMKREDDDGRS